MVKNNLVEQAARYLRENGKVVDFGDAKRRLRPNAVSEPDVVKPEEHAFMMLDRMGYEFVHNPQTWKEIERVKKLRHLDIYEIEQELGIRIASKPMHKYFSDPVYSVQDAMQKGIRPVSAGVQVEREGQKQELYMLYFNGKHNDDDEKWYLCIRGSSTYTRLWMPMT